MNPIASPQTVLLQLVKCLAGWLLVASAAFAAEGGTAASATALRTASWQEAAQYVIQALPACKEYSHSEAVVSIRDHRVSLYYADVDSGTIDAFPLQPSFTAEAHGSAGRWRLLVRFQKDVVTTDAPYLNGHGRSAAFSCDGDRDTTEGLGAALTRLHQLLASGLAAQQPDSLLPEIVVQNHRDGGRRLREGERITLSARVNAADLDLSAPVGADDLRARVSDKAHDICRQLELRSPDFAFPRDLRANQKCVRDAISGSAKQVDELVAAAKARNQ